MKYSMQTFQGAISMKPSRNRVRTISRFRSRPSPALSSTLSLALSLALSPAVCRRSADDAVEK
jgi:hypothetical protein